MYYYTGTSKCFYMVALAYWWDTSNKFSNWRTFLALMERNESYLASGPLDFSFAEERHLFTTDLYWVCWMTKEISKQYNWVCGSTIYFSDIDFKWSSFYTWFKYGSYSWTFLEIVGHELTLNELAHLTRCLVMLKTIIMGERQESVVGIWNYTFIVQCWIKGRQCIVVCLGSAYN